MSNKKLSDIKFMSYTDRFSWLYKKWQDENDPRRSERLQKMLDRQLKLEFRHYKSSEQIAWAQEQERRHRKGLNTQPLPTEAAQ